jgi:CHAT domain-containing protein
MHRTRPTRIYILLLGLFIALCAVAPAHAQRNLDAMKKESTQLFDAGKYAEALALQKKVVAATKARFGDQSVEYAYAVNRLGLTLRQSGRFSEAEAAYQSVLSFLEKTLPPDNDAVLITQQQLGALYNMEGRSSEAAALLERALAIREEKVGPSHKDVGLVLTDLGPVYVDLGRLIEAEQTYRRALAIQEAAYGYNSVDVLATLDNIGALYLDLARFQDAENIFKRVLAIEEEHLGASHPDTATPLHNLSVTASGLRRYDDALQYALRAKTIMEKIRGTNLPDYAPILIQVANAYVDLGRYSEAEPAARQALAVREKQFGPNHVLTARALDELADVFFRQGRFDESEAAFKRVLAVREQAYGANHLMVAEIDDELSSMYAKAGRTADALAFSRKALAIVVPNRTAQASQPRQLALTGDEDPGYYHRHVAVLAAASRAGLEAPDALAREAVQIAQWQTQTSAAAAVQQMAARFATGDGKFAALLRESQDAAARRRNQDSALSVELGKPQDQTDVEATGRLRQELIDSDARIAALAEQVQKEFPEAASLMVAKPLAVDEIQRLLGPDEAMVFWLVGDPDSSETFVFALTRDGFIWKTIPLGASALTERVAAFRRGLSVSVFDQPATGGKAELFDLTLAHELYDELLGPVDGLVKDKKQLLVVPTGALTALPVHLLVTAKPTGPAPSLDNLTAYRDAAWLIKRQAVTVLPSVGSLKALRIFAHADRATQPMVGFGDPIFGLEPDTAQGSAKTASRTLNTRSLADFWRGVGIDRAALASALPRLPDTADELKAVAAKLRAPASDIFLRANATEARVKQAPLAQYRVVYFATHGLVAGDVKGVAEPSLALTLPAQPSAIDDGLLTASEIAQLQLNADWVVLSACNTIAGDKPGAEALSGLARAFFYAGARALLVSHWAVASGAATRLTTSAFDILKAEPKVGRAEALRRAMLAYLNDRSLPYNAYPGFWGPFSIIGEGAAQ